MNPSFRKGILILLLIAILTIALAFIPNILSDDLGAWCKERWGEHYKYFLIVILTFCAVALVLLTTDLGKYFFPGAGKRSTDRFNIPPGPKSRHILDQAKAAIASAEPGEALRFLSDLKLSTLNTEIDLLSSRLVDYQRTRRHGVESPDTEKQTFNRITQDTLDLVRTLEKELNTGTENYDTIRDYLKKRYSNRLDQKLAKRQPVNLRRIPSTEGTSEERASTFVAYNSEEIGGTMASIFHEGRGRLLLLGAPGAGKTTLMIQLVLELLDSEPDSMPVLLNLATWNKDFITLETWLKEILPAELGVSKRFASEIIEQNRLILLFDGFDEIKEDDRVSCLEAIARYGEDSGRRYAISSRKKEYFEVAKDAPVESQIEVGPLSNQQLESELQRLWSDPVKPERGARLLWNAIQENELLRKVVETPFYFNSLQILFGGSKTWADLQIKAESVKEMQDQITARFVQYELDGAREKYTAEKSSHWLSFLASRMKERNMVVFELRDLQYDWWKLWTNWQLWLAGQVEGLVVSFAVSIFIGVFLGLSFGLIAWHFSQLSKGPLFGLFVCLFVWLYMLLYSVLFCIILVGLLKALFDGLFKRNPVIETKEIMSSSGINVIQIIKKNLPVVLLVGLIVALYYVEYGFFVIFALTIWMFRDMKTLDNSTHFIQIATPFHRFNSSMKNFYYSILQHKFLCYQLRKKGLLPLNLVTFLNDMSLRHILEFDGDPKTGTGGGSWRFRHRILQEYFAEKWVEPEDGGKK